MAYLLMMLITHAI